MQTLINIMAVSSFVIICLAIWIAIDYARHT
jgi:hypothetical protein